MISHIQFEVFCLISQTFVMT